MMKILWIFVGITALISIPFSFGLETTLFDPKQQTTDGGSVDHDVDINFQYYSSSMTIGSQQSKNEFAQELDASSSHVQQQQQQHRRHLRTQQKKEKEESITSSSLGGSTSTTSTKRKRRSVTTRIQNSETIILNRDLKKKKGEKKKKVKGEDGDAPKNKDKLKKKKEDTQEGDEADDDDGDDADDGDDGDNIFDDGGDDADDGDDGDNGDDGDDGDNGDDGDDGDDGGDGGDGGDGAEMVYIPTEEEYCPTGEESCCEMTNFEECRTLVFADQINFQNSYFEDGDTPWSLPSNGRGPIIPVNELLDVRIRDEHLGTYDGMTFNGNEFTFTILQILMTSEEIVQEQVESQVVQDIEDYDQKYTLFNGLVDGTGGVFVGLLISYIVPDTNEFTGLLYVIDDGLSTPPEDNNDRRGRILQGSISCSDTFNGIEECFSCPDPEFDFYTICKVGAFKTYLDFELDGTCKAVAINTCEIAIDTAQGEFDAMIETAEGVYEAAKIALQIKRVADISAVVAACAPANAGTPLAYAVCVAAGIAILEAKRYLLRKAAEEALEVAKQLAIENRDVLFQAAIDGVGAVAASCFIWTRIGCCTGCSQREISCILHLPCKLRPDIR